MFLAVALNGIDRLHVSILVAKRSYFSFVSFFGPDFEICFLNL